jgi:4'-phosphopantetheinyl transferase
LSEGKQRLPEWCVPPAEIFLASGDVHVWRLRDSELAAASVLHDTLAPDEKARAARLGSTRFRSYVGTRATLRSLLARYTNVDSDTVEFTYGPLGKPFSAGGVHFSVSHAGDRSLLAFSRSYELGVDLEVVKISRRFDALITRFFSRMNASTIRNAPPDELPRVFTEAWALREAYVKAVGGGLYATSDGLLFDPAASAIQHVLDAAGSPWTIAAIDAGEAEGFEAKLVVKGRVDRIACYESL